MSSDTAIISAIIGGIFAGLALLARAVLPYFRKSQEQPAVREVPLHHTPTHGAPIPKWVGVPKADQSGNYAAAVAGLDYGDLSDTNRGQQPAHPAAAFGQWDQTLSDIHQTLSDINSKEFASRADVQRMTDSAVARVSERISGVERKADTNTGNIAAIKDDVAFIKGKLSK